MVQSYLFSVDWFFTFGCKTPEQTLYNPLSPYSIHIHVIYIAYYDGFCIYIWSNDRIALIDFLCMMLLLITTLMFIFLIFMKDLFKLWLVSRTRLFALKKWHRFLNTHNLKTLFILLFHSRSNWGLNQIQRFEKIEIL